MLAHAQAQVAPSVVVAQAGEGEDPARLLSGGGQHSAAMATARLCPSIRSMCDQAESRKTRSASVKYTPPKLRWMKSRSSAAGPQISSMSAALSVSFWLTTVARAMTAGKVRKSLAVTSYPSVFSR
jgi:hypothetical protein